MWGRHTAEYYPALEREEILIPATQHEQTLRNVLSEIRQTQNDKHCMAALARGTWANSWTRAVEWRLLWAGGGRSGEMFGR